MARKTLEKFGTEIPEYQQHKSALGGEEIDPNILRMIAKKKKQGQMTARTQTVSQKDPEKSALSVKGLPIDPRQRAAMMMQQKIQQRIVESTAPGAKKKKKKKKKLSL